jgi:hypothetical protein
MEGMTIILGSIGGVAGGAGSALYTMLADVGDMGLGMIAAVTGAGHSNQKERSLPLRIGIGVLAGTLTLGSVPSIYEHFAGAAGPKPVTFQDCVKSAPANVSRVELATKPDGTKGCSFTP